MPHILVAGRLHAAGIERLKAAKGMSFTLIDEVSFESYVPHVKDADAILLRTQPMTAEVVAQAPRLRIVSRHGVGYDAIDVQALSARNIALTIVGDVNSRAVAEHTFMLMLSAARRTVAHDRASRSGNWNIRNLFETVELDGKTLLIVGIGRIGRRVAELAQAFGMKALAHDPFVPVEMMMEFGATPIADLHDGLAKADYVTLHMPPLKGYLIGAKELAAMKASAILVNAARGGLVDELALDRALRAGKLRGAALDVLSQEPPDASHALLSNDRVTISPHSAGLTDECAARMARAAVQNIVDFFGGSIDRSLIVNFDKIKLKP